MSMGMMVADNLEEIVATILQTGMERIPNEAGGIIVPTDDMPPSLWVIELKNISPHPHDSFLTDLGEAEERVRLRLEHSITPADVWLWHTHPGGHVGPSRMDLENRIPQVNYLVVALPDGPAVRY